MVAYIAKGFINSLMFLLILYQYKLLSPNIIMNLAKAGYQLKHWGLAREVYSITSILSFTIASFKLQISVCYKWQSLHVWKQHTNTWANTSLEKGGEDFYTHILHTCTDFAKKLVKRNPNFKWICIWSARKISTSCEHQFIIKIQWIYDMTWLSGR